MSGAFPPDNPLLVQWEYASEERLVQRNAVYRWLVEGEDPDDAAFAAVAEAAPRTVLDAGSGPGEFAARVQNELGAYVKAIDISPRMVALTAARGVDASLGNVQSLPFADDEFDCVVANWVLYHVPELERAVGEIHRVLRPGGRLVAASLGPGHMAEMWALVGGEATRDLSFWSENGEEVLRRRFRHVERRDARGTIRFPNSGAVREFVSATITRAHLAEQVPTSDEPFETYSRHVVFVAEKDG